MKKNSHIQSAEDKALDRFAKMMIAKINEIKGDWKKPWFTEGLGHWPANLEGREYNGLNSFMLLFHCQESDYKIPRFLTLATARRLNKEHPEKDENGEKRPPLIINKGEKSFPVILVTFTCQDKETGERIPYDDWKNLTPDEKEKYKVFPRLHVYLVFNVAQTNIEEARPKHWANILKEYDETEKQKELEEKQNGFVFEPFDKMLKDKSWICEIATKHQDNAYYNILSHRITIPEKDQFREGEEFYSTAFHEMAHSTGHKDVFNRFNSSNGWGVDKNSYAREELVAEMSAAVTAAKYGFGAHIKEESCKYLKNWLGALKESPSFIKTVLVDVKKASKLIVEKVDKAKEQLDREKEQQQKAGVTDVLTLALVGQKPSKEEETEERSRGLAR